MKTVLTSGYVVRTYNYEFTVTTKTGTRVYSTIYRNISTRFAKQKAEELAKRYPECKVFREIF